MASRRSVYRKTALEKLSSPEELDQLLQVTGMGAWLLLAGFGVALLMIVLWGIFGQLTTSVEEDGLLTLSNPVVFIEAPAPGLLSEMIASPNDTVGQGQVVARLDTVDGPINVISAVNGRVLSMRVARGEPVDAGTPLLSLESFDREEPAQEVVLFVSLDDRQSLRPGQSARMLPSTVERERYGYLEGEVSYVSQFAATRPEMQVVLSEASLMQDLVARGTVFEVRVTPKMNSDGRFVWSASDGPSQPVVSGTPVQVIIDVDQERPISRVFNLD